MPVIALPNNNFPKEITKDFLDGFLKKTVEDFCPNFGKVGDADNHCAHWVSHALGFRIGKLCNTMTWEHRKDFESGRSLVVNDLFNSCPERGLWSDKPKELDCCLIFATLQSAVSSSDGQLQMENIRRKHVGIYFKGSAYNYHNNTNEGVAVNGEAHFANLYGKGTVALYGTFPQ